MSKHIQDTSTSLNEQLLAYRQRGRALKPDFAAAYDALVERLAALDAGGVGPKVGERMPSFVLPDEEGHLVSLDAMLRHGPVVISFNRGHWCPYCKMDLRAFAASHGRIVQLGGSLVSIMPDSANFTADYAKKNELPFPVLSDIDLGYALSLGLIFWVGSEIQRLYQEAGVLLDIYHGNQSYFLPIAAKFIVDRNGLIRAREVNLEFRARMEPETVISVLEELHTE